MGNGSFQTPTTGVSLGSVVELQSGYFCMKNFILAAITFYSFCVPRASTPN